MNIEPLAASPCSRVYLCKQVMRSEWEKTTNTVYSGLTYIYVWFFLLFRAEQQNNIKMIHVQFL